MSPGKPSMKGERHETNQSAFDRGRGAVLRRIRGVRHEMHPGRVDLEVRAGHLRFGRHMQSEEPRCCLLADRCRTAQILRLAHRTGSQRLPAGPDPGRGAGDRSGLGSACFAHGIAVTRAAGHPSQIGRGVGQPCYGCQFWRPRGQTIPCTFPIDRESITSFRGRRLA